MLRINDVSTPHTLKTIKTQDGTELVLKGVTPSLTPKDSYQTNYLKLYQKKKVDGLDTFQLVAKKEEKHLLNDGGSFVSVTKERFNTKTGELVEQSQISKNVFGGKNIECVGDVFSVQGSVSTNLKSNKASIVMDTTKGELTPIAKRILKIILK